MMLRTSNCLAAALAASLGTAGVASAQTAPGHCPGAVFSDTLAVARIAKSRQKVAFVRGVHDDKACPSHAEGCRGRTFLAPGDVVLTSERHGDFVCATYVNSRNHETIGWLPAAALEPVSPAPAAVPSGWTGTWRRIEASIHIKPAPGGALAVGGSATWGSYDPVRVANGTVRSGEISGTARLAGGSLFISDEPAASFEKAPTSACAVRMRRLAQYLLVEDNNACGGMSVSFSGIYVRK